MRRTLVLVLVASACGGAQPRPARPRHVVEMEELRIAARSTGGGEYEFEVYDAEQLFSRATDQLRAERCEQAVQLYDRLLTDFPTTRYKSAALYNSGLCLRHAGDLPRAAERYSTLIHDLPTSEDTEAALFQLADIDVELERFADAVQVSETLLARTTLSASERLEAMARRAQGLLGTAALDDAEAQARDALTFYRTRTDDDRIVEPYFAGAANFVLADVLRHRSEAIAIPRARVQEQREVLEQRAGILLDAQRAYFDTIRHSDPHWAAAAGYAIGALYDNFWTAVTEAPIPPPETEMPAEALPLYEQRYREELARLVRPLIRHAIRYWEMTLLMIERTGVETTWGERARADLERARARLLESSAAAPGPPTVSATPGG